MNLPRETIPPPTPPLKCDLKLKLAQQAINNLKSRGYEDAKNIAVVLEYIMEKIK